ncbi:MAG: MFS transporter [Gammaproteobacteria bacterium]|nr:MFS transporter [Gammaproteobacteria bacterium]MBT8105151.1 MFS transporter [Gammaproteobacteria bacterium]NNK25165.1 MFS transporter [Woeseiaceae bacterium]
MISSRDLYELLTNEEDARLCRDIDERACRESPHNFTYLLASYFLTKLGDAIASPKTTLAWLTTAVGAPAFVLGLLVPIRESGSLIPQLFIGGIVRRLPVRKWVWVAGSIVQGACIVGIGLVALQLEGAAAGWSILVLVSVFSLARGFCSVSSKDVLGKTVPKKIRGQLNGWSASAAGLLTIGVGIVLMSSVSEIGDTALIGALLIGAGLLWVLAAAVFSFVAEYPGESGGARSAADSLAKLSLLVTDRPFRRFVITRALLLCSALSAPFYVALAQGNIGSTAMVLGYFVAAAGFASLVSAPVWGRFADQSSRKVMVVAALLTSGIGLLTFGVHELLPALSGTAWFLPLAYFALSIAHSGVRVGRKTYVVDLATGNKRTDYVAISNTVIGVMLLLVGGVGALSPLIGNHGVIALLSFMGMVGAVLGIWLPETQHE